MIVSLKRKAGPVLAISALAIAAGTVFMPTSAAADPKPPVSPATATATPTKTCTAAPKTPGGRGADKAFNCMYEYILG
jgi:hypothetical protein